MPFDRTLEKRNLLEAEERVRRGRARSEGEAVATLVNSNSFTVRF